MIFFQTYSRITKKYFISTAVSKNLTHWKIKNKKFLFDKKINYYSPFALKKSNKVFLYYSSGKKNLREIKLSIFNNNLKLLKDEKNITKNNKLIDYAPSIIIKYNQWIMLFSRWSKNLKKSKILFCYSIDGIKWSVPKTINLKIFNKSDNITHFSEPCIFSKNNKIVLYFEECIQTRNNKKWQISYLTQ